MDEKQGLIEICIQSLTGASIDFLVSSQETVLGIKVRIQRLKDIPVTQQNLVWDGKELQNSHSLQNYGIQTRAVLKLVLSLKGGPISTKRIQLDEPKIHEMVEYLAEIDDSASTSSSSSSTFSDSNKASSKKGVTVIVYQRGSRLSFYKVLDRGPNSPTLCSPDLNGSERSSNNLLSKYDELKKMKDRLSDNGMTKSKMLCLKSQMKKMAAKKANKRVKGIIEEASQHEGARESVPSSTRNESTSTEGPGFCYPAKSYLRCLNQKNLLQHYNPKYLTGGNGDGSVVGARDSAKLMTLPNEAGEVGRKSTLPNEAGEVGKKSTLPTLKALHNYKHDLPRLNREFDVGRVNNRLKDQNTSTTFHNSLLKYQKLKIDDKSLPPPMTTSCKTPDPTGNSKFSLPPLKSSPKRIDEATMASYLEGMQDCDDTGFYRHMKNCLSSFEGKDWDFIYKKMMMEDNIAGQKDNLKNPEANKSSKRGILFNGVGNTPAKLSTKPPTPTQFSRKKSISPQPSKYFKSVGKKVCRESSITELKVSSQASSIEAHSNQRFFKSPYSMLPPLSISKQAIDTACEPVSSDSTLSSNLSDDSSSPSFHNSCTNYNTFTYRNLASQYDLDDDSENDDDNEEDDEEDEDDENNQSFNLPLTLLSPDILNYKSQIKKFLQDKLNDNFPLISTNFQEQIKKTSYHSLKDMPTVLPSIHKPLCASHALKSPKLQSTTSKSSCVKRCFVCRRRTPLATSFICRCEKNFCTIHRYPECHNCSYDYKFEGRKALKESSHVVAAPKLPKI